MRCERCGRRLEEGREVFLEGDVFGAWFRPGEVDEADSLGGFPFGSDCARRALEESRGISRNSVDDSDGNR